MIMYFSPQTLYLSTIYNQAVDWVVMSYNKKKTYQTKPNESFPPALIRSTISPLPLIANNLT